MASDDDNDDNAGRSVYGTAERTDKGLYALPTDPNWEFKPILTLSMQKDCALAVDNAVDVVWPDTVDDTSLDDEIVKVKGMCTTHASLIWFKKNRKFFKTGRDTKVQQKKLQADFETYKNCPILKAVPVLRKKMLVKWTNVHKERTVAMQWNKSWGKSVLTRVEMNKNNVLRAGIPTDNNAVEGGNRWDKELLEYRKDPIALFLPRLGKLLEGHSRTDMSFGLNAKNAIHRRDFYKEVETIIRRHRNHQTSMLSLQFPFASVRNDVPQGSLIVAGENCLNEIHEIFNADGDIKDCDDIQQCRDFLIKNRWVEEYKRVVKDPEKTCQDMTFDEIVAVFKHFHLLRPIVVHAEDSLAVGSVTQLHRMLESSGVGMMPLDELLDLPVGKGLVTCDCKTYLHYCWCKHSCACAFDRGIVTSYPPLLNPVKVSRQAAAAGRPKHSKRGGAFTKDG